MLSLCLLFSFFFINWLHLRSPRRTLWLVCSCEAAMTRLVPPFLFLILRFLQVLILIFANTVLFRLSMLDFLLECAFSPIAASGTPRVAVNPLFAMVTNFWFSKQQNVAGSRRELKVMQTNRGAADLLIKKQTTINQFIDPQNQSRVVTLTSQIWSYVKVLTISFKVYLENSKDLSVSLHTEIIFFSFF